MNTVTNIKLVLTFLRNLFKLKFPVFSLALILFSVSLMILPGCLGKYYRTTRAEYKNLLLTNSSFDAIIVPGIPYTKRGWNTLMKARVLWSWILYKNGMARNVIYSGGAVCTPYHEALVMGLYAQKLGIPRDHIFYDTCASHSTENVYYSYLIAQEKGFKKLAIATDFYQSFYLHGFVKKHIQTSIFHLPFVRDSLKRYESIYLNIDPKPAQIPNPETFRPLKEKRTYFQRMKGTLGKDIDWANFNNNDPESRNGI
jgi:vancomycin permeability regulator SanA